jgi:hypothetical protein
MHDSLARKYYEVHGVKRRDIARYLGALIRSEGNVKLRSIFEL